MTRNEALSILFNVYGRAETFLWMDVNNPSNEEIIKKALKTNGKLS